MKLPMQPVEVAKDGVVRFVPNRIVEFLLDLGQLHGHGLNEIVLRHKKGGYTQAELEQFCQLIGYSVDAYADLSFVSGESWKEAETKKESLVYNGCGRVGGPLLLCCKCRRQKAPAGRSAPAELPWCDDECPGYRAWPSPGSLWPGEACVSPICQHKGTT